VPLASRSLGAAIALALHALAGVVLLNHEPARSVLFAAAPIMVELVTPPMVQPEPQRPVTPVDTVPPPKPKRVVKPRPVTAPRPKPSDPQPVIAAPPMPEVPAPKVPIVAQPEPAPVVAAPSPAPTPPAIVPVTPPVFDASYLDNPPPAYPALSRRRGEQGSVMLRVLVSIFGKADEVQIRSSSGYARLDEAARNTVRGWKFVPAKRGEEPVAAWVLVPVSFRLEG
jgi:protein TonB